MKFLITVLAITTIVMSTATAQTAQKANEQNPFGLVYGGAITENVKGKVNIHPVTYNSQRHCHSSQCLHTCQL